MSASVSRFRTMNLANGATSVGVAGTPSGTYALTVKAVSGAVQVANSDNWNFTPLAISDFTTNSDLDVFHLDEGESLEFTVHEDGTGNICVASGNASGGGDSVVSLYRRPL